MADERDAFYVGYEERAQPSLKRFLRTRIIALGLFFAGLMALFAAAQDEFRPSLFEFGSEREFTGWISEKPVPLLVMLRPGDTSQCGSISTFGLVAFGKTGAQELVAGLDGHAVSLRGTLSHLDDKAFIEVNGEGLTRVDRPQPRPESRSESVGSHRLVGEIVDSKCFYGVMNPGSGKVHRACAARCISGGIPASFLVEDEAGQRITLLLVDPSGRALSDALLDSVGQTVALTGEVIRQDDLLVFYTDIESLERQPLVAP